ncbi:MAG TPA: hypothetical protein VMU75_15925 [Acidimicrobiales bacterium]|nr:hypothetical protein [Acidimicrobiales bacterium]
MRGVWWTTKRGWVANQASVAFEVCREPSSVTTWIDRSSSMLTSISSKKEMEVTESLRPMSFARTLPVATSSEAVP